MELKPGYKQTEVGVIPEEWIIEPLESLTPQNKKYGIVDGPFGSNLKTEHYRKSGVPIVTSGYVTSGFFSANEYLYVDEEKFRQEKRSTVRGGDIVMAKIGANCGASAILPINHEESILSGNALKITIDENKYSTFYVWQVIWSLHIKGDFELIKSTGAQPAVSMANLKKFKIPLPPTKEEQTAIAGALSDADGLIAALERLIAKKRQIKQGAMQTLLNPHDENGRLKTGWMVKTLGEVAVMSSGGTPLTSNAKYYDGSIPWVVIADITKAGKYISSTEKTITNEGLANSSAKLFRKGILLFAMYASIGKTTIATMGTACNQAILGIEAKKIDAEYLYYFLSYNEDKFAKMGQTGTQSNLSKEIVQSISIDVPPVTEQTRIATILSDMDAEIDALETKLAKARAVKQGMMQNLLSGRIRLI